LLVTKIEANKKPTCCIFHIASLETTTVLKDEKENMSILKTFRDQSICNVIGLGNKDKFF